MLERDWKLLIIIYNEKNITKASKKLYLSQPAVTRRLKHIEEEFNVKIVERNSKGVHFTEQGKYLVKCAEQMIENLNNIRRDLDSMNNKIEGTIKIGTAKNFSQRSLPNILFKYKMLYPDVNFEIVTGWSNDMYKLLCDKKIDIAFVRGEYKWSQGEKKLFDASLCIISANKIEKSDLPLMNRVEYSSDFKLKDVIEDWWKSNFTSASLKAIKIDSIDSCCEMVKQRLGYAIVPSTVIKKTDQYFKINLEDKDGNMLTRRTRAFYHNDWESSKLGKTFLDFINTLEFENN